MEEKRKLKFIVYTFLLLLLTGTIGYKFLLNISFLDAAYMTVITISTVGFGEVAAMDAEAKIFSIIMIFWGVGIVGYAFTTIVVMFVEGKILDIWKGRKMANKIENLKDHYIICGSGELADIIVENLKKEGHDFVLIVSNPEDLISYEEREVPAIEGDPSSEEVLKKAGIERAKGLVSCLETEAENIVCVLTARSLNPDIYIIANSFSESGGEKLKKVGADKTLSSVEISGRRMAALLTKPHIISFLDVITKVGSVELDLEEVTVMKDSYLENKTLKEAQIPKKTGLTVMAIRIKKDGSFVFNPPADYVFQLGDVLVVLGEEEKVDKLRDLGDELLK